MRASAEREVCSAVRWVGAHVSATTVPTVLAPLLLPAAACLPAGALPGRLPRRQAAQRDERPDGALPAGDNTAAGEMDDVL